jgi:hypothetical protein
MKESSKGNINIERVNIEGEDYFKISNHHLMRPFFMSIVSDSNHWMFVSSNGGLTAGRRNSEFALFPYYTDDKITDLVDTTGCKTIFQIDKDDTTYLWEPFVSYSCGNFEISRNIYKSVYCNKIIFEEVNLTLGLKFSYQWCLSHAYGLVRKSLLINNSPKNVFVKFLDGVQNILPATVNSDLQTSTSNLVDAYKRGELHESTGLGIFSLSSIISDKAEPNEALKSNILYSLGLENPTYLLSSLQLNNFRKNIEIHSELDIKGEKSAYFVHNQIGLKAGESTSWMLIGEVNQSHSQLSSIIYSISNEKNLVSKIEADIDFGTKNLIKLVASADGLKSSTDHLIDSRHFSNVLYNIMRGGILDNNYEIEKDDFCLFLKRANKQVFENSETFINQLPASFLITDLKSVLENQADSDLLRLSKEYLPLKFSRRHGDPSRPWNKFSINTVDEVTGAKILNYEGNWRDIFQNWEALVHSYPEIIEALIYKFLNASTFDGYNPYRVTKDGFDWETIEPDNPWSYIGYWGDHQIIYLLKFLEFYHKKSPSSFRELLYQEHFVYANVPYKIKKYKDIVLDSKNTIEFDEESDLHIRERMKSIGSDGSLLLDNDDNVYKVNFIEKILATVLAKISNFVPEGGIWMNTQRPDWNDANNALVGNGISMVNLYYLRRFLSFFQPIIESENGNSISISEELSNCFKSISNVLLKYSHLLSGEISDKNRKTIVDDLGEAASFYRQGVYENNFSGKKNVILYDDINIFVKTALQFLDHTIKSNKRNDHLFHAYNLLSIDGDTLKISRLDEMLEGQVAVLSSKYLKAEEVVVLLEGLRSSKLYRPDQNSYLLYPNKNLPGFLAKNNVDFRLVEKSPLLTRLISTGDKRIVQKGIDGKIHFNSNFKNSNDLKLGLEDLKNSEYKALYELEEKNVLDIYEQTFNHKSYTGRSGSFFAYEGLGSIYWHMVSKLHLAVQEVFLDAKENGVNSSILNRIKEFYQEIGEGIGVHKSPDVYGAFPTDAYSHTPYHKGAQQPGMTGQVKEDVLVSIGEMGIILKNDLIGFTPSLLDKTLFSEVGKTIKYLNVFSQEMKIELPARSLFFTYCQVPIIYTLTDGPNQIKVNYENNDFEIVEGLFLEQKSSGNVIQRNGLIKNIQVLLNENFE